jgi:hypothetical protein
MTVDPTQPVITAVGLLALRKRLQDHGVDWRRTLEEVGIDPEMAIDTEAVVSLQSAFELLENSARYTGDEAFGLHLGESFPINITGALAYVTLNAPDLRTFCKDTVRFLGLVAYGYTSRFEEGDAMSYLVHEIPHHLGPPRAPVACAMLRRTPSCRSTSIPNVRRRARSPSITAFSESWCASIRMRTGLV